MTVSFADFLQSDSIGLLGRACKDEYAPKREGEKLESGEMLPPAATPVLFCEETANARMACCPTKSMLPRRPPHMRLRESLSLGRMF